MKDQKKALIVEKHDRAFSLLNRYPYNNGHIMVAPIRHIGNLELLDDEELLSLHNLIRRAMKSMTLTMQPQGFNIGINQGHIAGAGVIDHIHIHVVPRWQGDTNFMPVLSDTKVVSESLMATYEKIQDGLYKLDHPA